MTVGCRSSAAGYSRTHAYNDGLPRYLTGSENGTRVARYKIDVKIVILCKVVVKEIAHFCWKSQIRQDFD